ncbi:hypothetical protein D3273_13760 [Lichenibacterium minor]|jgi:hypothetical protein|uniref:Uncharacterized protein n=1 Tax=Lichenibacterium minor TaxID=2316528 RepID=A0A4Q2U4H1_9HYPH|nr:hypothetical protein [Lichenibacterium minor]RYC31443.1 hypothetical protein D3273_13760 [Lichenibacterium minor]
MKHLILALSLLAVPAAALAQTANVSPTSPSSTSPGNVSRTAPSGSTAKPDPGVPQVGAPTPTEQHYEHKAQKDTTSVCKGC